MARRETSEEIDHAAADWAARLDGEPLSADERVTLEAWMAEDPRRQGALARAMAILTHFDRAKALGPQFDARAQRRANTNPRLGRREFMAGGAMAAAIGGAGLIIPGWIQQSHQFKTGKGEVRSVPLDDGSVVWMNTESKIRVDYSKERRGIVLLAGEALFDVAKDRARPFVVRAAATDVRAVGTSFSVSRLPGQPIEVMVREGIVDVAKSAATPVRLAAGARAISNAAGVQVSSPGPEAVTRALSWRRGMLDFDGTTLAEAVSNFARYSDQKIIIDDPEIGQRSVTGLFSSTDPVGFAEAVALSMNLRTRTEPGVVHLSR